MIRGLNSPARIRRRAIRNTMPFPLAVNKVARSSLDIPLTRTTSSNSRQSLSEKSLDSRKRVERRAKFEFADRSLKNLSVSNSSTESDSVLNHTRAGLNSQVMQQTVTNYNQIKTMSALLPEEVLQDMEGVLPRTYDVVLVFIDISGFTGLCEKYDKTGKGGPSKLTEELNEYMEVMIDILLSRGGDVLNFAGDALLCMWKVTKERSMAQCVRLGIDSGLFIKKNCGEHITAVGVLLRVKIAVSAGQAVFAIIGTQLQKNYIIVGDPVLDVKHVMQDCKPGDVMVSSRAWQQVEHVLFYSYNRHHGVLIKVEDFGPLWTPRRQPKGAIRQKERTRSVLDNLSTTDLETFRPFILPSVMRSLDRNEPLDYLTEMRQVSIAFFNMKTRTPSWQQVMNYADIVYQVICQVTTKAKGTVNKIFYFDKDLTVLCVFGLRGFQHRLSSEVALKAAFDCITTLQKFSFVVSASVGVTTGMTYCGVVGHASRKEYTVMGPPVNMAARLMCEYEGIVSCDRDTFLYSRLKAIHFDILEEKILKGVMASGLHYKYIGTKRRPKAETDSTAYPILGRTEELKIYEGFLHWRRFEHILLIQGRAGVGKSRLMERFLRQADTLRSSSKSIEGLKTASPADSTLTIASSQPGLDVHAIPLTEDDYKVAFATTRLIFEAFVCLSKHSIVEDRADRIRNILGGFVEEAYLASLNSVFNTNFKLLPDYTSKTEQHQRNIRSDLQKMFFSKYLSTRSRCLVLIDDAEFIDEDSWPMVAWFATEQNVRLVLTIGQRRPLSGNAEELLSFTKYRTIVLDDVPKWFRTAIACQIMNVRALPVELERLVNVCRDRGDVDLTCFPDSEIEKSKDSGNPGWLENFLFILIQSNGIQITQMSEEDIQVKKLVVPPIHLVLPGDGVTDDPFENWEQYDEVFKQDHRHKSQELLSVCVLGPNFQAAQTYDSKMDVVNVHIVDTLKPLEQLILKAGSTMGFTFLREMLKFVIQTEYVFDEKELAKAIKNLYQMRIIECAKGDFTNTTSLMLPERRISGHYQDIKCECVGLPKPVELCRNLPDYAFCGYLKFRASVFRNTMYSLLLNDQKLRFHTRCIKFLENYIPRCSVCSGALFTNILPDEAAQGKLGCCSFPVHGMRSTQMPSYKPPVKNPPEQESSRRTDPSLPIANSFLAHNLIGCQCPEILSVVYSMLRGHAENISRPGLVLEILMEHAVVLLTSCNMQNTVLLLEDARSVLKSVGDELKLSPLCKALLNSKICVLMGMARLGMGSPDAALQLFKRALAFLGYEYPQRTGQIKWKSRKERLRRMWLSGCFSESRVGQTTGDEALVSNVMAVCLGEICLVYLYRNNWLSARLAALWGLNKALESNKNLLSLCSAYSNSIYFAYHEKNMAACVKLERCSLEMCRAFSTSSLEGFELEAISRLYYVIFQARQIRAEMEAAIHIGFQSLQIATLTRVTKRRLELIPDLIFLLIQLNRISEAVPLLNELEFLATQDSDKSSTIWYHALCLDLQLDTGFTVISYQTCQSFLEKEQQTFGDMRDAKAFARLCTSMWVWCIRNEDHDTANALSQYLAPVVRVGRKKKEDMSVAVAVTYTQLRRLEGVLVYLVSRIEACNIAVIKSLYHEARYIMKNLHKQTRVITFLRPRYLLLKAYYRQIRYRDDYSFKLLNKVIFMAAKVMDHNTEQWARHNFQVWKNRISPVQRDQWREHCNANPINWHEAESKQTSRAAMFSLTLPKYR